MLAFSSPELEILTNASLQSFARMSVTTLNKFSFLLLGHRATPYQHSHHSALPSQNLYYLKLSEKLPKAALEHALQPLSFLDITRQTCKWECKYPAQVDQPSHAMQLPSTNRNDSNTMLDCTDVQVGTARAASCALYRGIEVDRCLHAHA